VSQYHPDSLPLPNQALRDTPRSSSGRDLGIVRGAQVGGQWRLSAYTYP
jgi:hypothetical protein